jgi:DNA (cytosine-5)-methyltransferase 1
MRYFSVCSGIEAASVAWHDMGWSPQGFSEIEEFPCEVLKQRFPNVKNYGDLTRWKEWNLEPGTVDVLVGGPPCQAFSVAGLREGMDDPRGNLSLVYFGLVNHLKPKWIIYENVPGLLSSRSGSDFSSLLTALASCGYGFAYRVLDSQFYGVPQRRRRVFIVGCRTGDWRHPAAVLFDGKGSFGRSTAQPTTWENPSAVVAGSVDGNSRINCTATGISGTVTNKWHKGTGGPAGDEHYNLITQPSGRTDGGEPGLVEQLPVVLDRAAYSQGVNAKYDPLIKHDNSVPALVARGPHAIQPPPIAFKVRCGGEYSGAKGGEVKPNERGGTGMLHYEDKTFTVAATQDQFVATPSQVLYENHPNDSRVTGPHDVAPTIAARFGTGGGNVPFVQNTTECISWQPGNLRRAAGAEPNTETTTTLKASMGDQIPHIATPMAVRRLTPEECERLQGFPAGWTRIPWRNKPASECPDGARYKCIGNSMTTNVMKWIGQRIQMVDDLVATLPKQG